MKIINAIRHLFQFLVHRRATRTAPAALPAATAALDLDAPTPSGLPLREAMPVRCAEYWLALGQPARALEELQNLSAAARRHPWAWQVQLMALNAGATIN